MSLPKPINWINQQQGSADWLFYQHICQTIKNFEDIETPAEFTSAFHAAIVNFEDQYPSLSNNNTVSTLKMKVYQQIISQLPLEVGENSYTFEDLVEIDTISKKISLNESITSLMVDDDFVLQIWNALSLGLKICNYQDKGIAAMRETMTIDWIQAQSKTPMFFHKASLIKLTAEEPGNHGFEGLGSLFG
jgi:hypothetical protein|tara:strand:+ start:3241 stop:3810 length:570 start_codon:yes stop_codon:yes gene_type:complete